MLLKVVVLDNAGFHRRKDLVVPPNILLLFLPPYTPELNPMERFWQEIRRELKGQNFDTLDQLSEKIEQYICNLDRIAVCQTVGYPVYRTAIEVCQDMACVI